MPKIKPASTLQPEMQPSIRLTSFHAIECNFSLETEVWEKYEFENLKFNLTYDPVTHEERSNYFGVIFNFSLEDKEKSMKMEIKYIGHFEINGMEISDETINTPFFKSNAPAILFPYFRNYVSTYFLNSGFKPIILPAFNFFKAKPATKNLKDINVKQ